MAFVSVEPFSGTLRRYEQVDRGMVRLTHFASQHGPATFTRAIVEEFRSHPEPRFAVLDDPDPPPPPPCEALRRAISPA